MTQTPKNAAQVFPNPFPSSYCDIFCCRERAKYHIGRPDGPLNIVLRVCDKHMKEIVASMPAELLPQAQEPEAPISEVLPAEEVQEPEVPAEVAETPDEEEEKSFVCECGKAFAKAAFLGSHQRSCKVHKEVEPSNE